MSRFRLAPRAAAIGTFLFLTACTGMASGPATLKATLTGTQEVPPVATQGAGTGTVTFDAASKRLTWNVAYSGLSGPATAAHFHGPASPGANAGVVVPIAAAGMSSPLAGQATLTDAQAADLMAGRWYINIHTAANPGGEIRGQVAR